MHPTDPDEERRLIGAIGAHTKNSRTDPAAGTRAAREALWLGYQRQVDPDWVLTPEERERRAIHARKADMARLALKSVQARRTKARAIQEAQLWEDSEPGEVAQ